MFFVDTSALAKRYLTETGSTWVKSWILPISGHVIVISELAQIEFFSLLKRREREKTLSPTSVTGLQNAFLSHLKTDYLTIDVDKPLLRNARNLVNQHPLRTLDAIQLACALHANQFLNQAITFVSGDNNLLAAAAAEGFLIDNPNNHP